MHHIPTQDCIVVLPRFQPYEGVFFFPSQTRRVCIALKREKFINRQSNTLIQATWEIFGFQEILTLTLSIHPTVRSYSISEKQTEQGG